MHTDAEGPQILPVQSAELARPNADHAVVALDKGARSSNSAAKGVCLSGSRQATDYKALRVRSVTEDQREVAPSPEQVIAGLYDNVHYHESGLFLVVTPVMIDLGGRAPAYIRT